MGQTITVVDGISVGTPGTATVAISGAVTPAWVDCTGSAKSTCTEVWNGGSLSLTIGQKTYTTSFGEGATASSVASALVSAMNTALSPVSATLSGDTITIQSTLNGTGTDYPLSVSYSYNTSFFTHPAFTATLSGANLTGGTN